MNPGWHNRWDSGGSCPQRGTRCSHGSSGLMILLDGAGESVVLLDIVSSGNVGKRDREKEEKNYLHKVMFGITCTK